MARTYYLERTQLIPQPLPEVFAFFADASNLEIITPEFLHFRILTPLPIRMEVGTLIDYRLKRNGRVRPRRHSHPDERARVEARRPAPQSGEQ